MGFKFKQGDVVRIRGISFWRRLVGMKNYRGQRLWIPRHGRILGYRPDMAAWEVWTNHHGIRMQQWFFTEDKLTLSEGKTQL